MKDLRKQVVEIPVSWPVSWLLSPYSQLTLL